VKLIFIKLHNYLKILISYLFGWKGFARLVQKNDGSLSKALFMKGAFSILKR